MTGFRCQCTHYSARQSSLTRSCSPLHSLLLLCVSGTRRKKAAERGLSLWCSSKTYDLHEKKNLIGALFLSFSFRAAVAILRIFIDGTNLKYFMIKTHTFVHGRFATKHGHLFDEQVLVLPHSQEPLGCNISV